ncbi:MAG TPA: hypothetical protein VF530_21480 [Planctomycetota bacterium]
MLATFVLSLALGSLPASGSDVGAVVACLERARAWPAPDAARLQRELAALGPALHPELFTVLAFGTDAEGALEPQESAALLGALSVAGSRALRPWLAPRLSDSPPAEERLAALELMARIGTGADVDLLRKAMHGAPPGIDGALQAACAAMVRADASALEPLRRWLIESPQRVGPVLARGLADSERPEALGTLAQALGFHATLEAELLEAIARLAPAHPKPLDEPTLGPLRAALERDDARTLRAAAQALARAEDPHALPGLIALLAHEAPSVRAGAEDALERLSGLGFGADPSRWEAWRASEEGWWTSSLARLRAELASPDPGLAIRALGELSSHRWPRHELALEAAAALWHEDRSVRRLACLALTRIGSGAAIPELQALVEAGGESVAPARRALQALGVEGTVGIP